MRVFFTISANTLDCEVLINAVHFRPALREQSDKNYQNRDLKLKLWKEVAAECYSCKQKCYFLFIDCNSIISCVEGIIQK